MSASTSLILAIVETLESHPAETERLRRALGIQSADAWVSVAVVANELGIEPRVMTDDARRGRITLGHAGRTPVVLRSEVSRWLTTSRPAARPATTTTPETSTATAGRSAAAKAAARWSR